MTAPTHEASARQRSGGPSPVLSRRRNSKDRPRGEDPAEIGRQIAELVVRSTNELRLAWRELHRAELPQGLSRDLLIRALANAIQVRTYNRGKNRARHRLQNLAKEFEKGDAFCAPVHTLRNGTTLLRQWRGHAHAVLVREDGFEYDGQRYRSLSVIAKRITGAHWSGPRFFGLIKKVSASAAAEAGR
jgi:hypothetical protein